MWPPEGIDSGVGLSKHPVHDAWYQMLRRCYWEPHKEYKNYGGRGISVDLELRSLINYIKLLNDLGIDYFWHGCTQFLDRTDNDGNYTRLNLRLASRSEQNANQRQRVSANYPIGNSGYRGVSIYNPTGKFRARIGVKGRGEVNLGYFETPEEAARAYDLGAKLYHGDRARFNFPEDL